MYDNRNNKTYEKLSEKLFTCTWLTDNLGQKRIDRLDSSFNQEFIQTFCVNSIKVYKKLQTCTPYTKDHNMVFAYTNCRKNLTSRSGFTITAIAKLVRLNCKALTLSLA